MSLFSHDRRHFPRRRLKSLAYIDLGSDSGGIVLNISEGGLALHSAVVLNRRPLPSVRFQLPDSPAWVTAPADIAWINASRKQAGIRFAGLPDIARHQIRQWVASWSADDSGAGPLGGAMELASLTLGNVPETPAVPPSREPDGVERKLRLHFAHRRPVSDRETPAQRRIWWSFVAVIGSLAIASLAVGWVAGRGKLSVLPRILDKAIGGTLAHARMKPATALLAVDTANAASIATPGTPAAAASLPFGAGLPASAGRVSVTSEAYLPMPVPAAGSLRAAHSVRMGYIERRVDPVYPAPALAQRIQGTVQLRATIGPNGTVAGISVLSGPPPLVAAAENAVRTWRYAPTLLDGQPVQTEARVTITFSLAKSH